MKRILALAMLAIAAPCAHAQNGVTVTPNIGLQVPYYGQTNWQVPLNYSLKRLDCLLSAGANCTLPGLNMTGPITLPGSPTQPLQAATKQYVDSLVGGGNATQLQGTPIANTAPISGQLFGFNGTTWGPITVSATNAASLQGTPVASTAPADQQVLGYNAAANQWRPTTVKSGSQRVVYTSVLLGTTGDAIVAPGSSTTGTDRAASLNAALNGGNVRLVVDGQYGLSTSLIVGSNTAIDCLPGQGFIMQPASDLPMFVNAHPNGATTSNGTGGYLPSNITDSYLSFHGCVFNFNSTQAVTGTDPLYNTPHHVSAKTGKWVLGFQLLGVSHLDISDNETYDSGAYNVAMSNVQYVTFNRNIVHQPLPLVAFKNTDGFHIVGPAAFVDLNDNHINAGDDSIALNADDGNVPVGADPNASYVTWAGWQNGNITNVTLDGNTLDYSISGVRFYTGTSLVDQIAIRNTSGSTKTGSMFLSNNAAMGPGNIGRVAVDDWNVQPDGSNTEGVSDVIGVTSAVSSFSVCNLHYAHPLVNWPIFSNTGTIGMFRACNWQIDTTASSFATAFNTAGAINSMALNGISWIDNATNTAPFINGTTVPATITVSNYTGPNRLLASGYTPTYKNGDAFTNTYPSTNYGTIYVQSAFNEQAAGTSLNGTTPATCANGCTGTWTTSTPSGAPVSSWQYGSAGAVQTYAIPTAGTDIYTLINAGVSNYVVRVTIPSGVAGGQQFFVRYGSPTSQVVVDFNQSAMGIYDQSNGSVTTVATTGGNFATPGAVVISVSGNTISVTSNGQTISGSLPSGSVNTTSGQLGPNMYTASGMTMSSLTVSSQ